MAMPDEQETLHTGKFLSLKKEGKWEYASRNNPVGAVGVLAITPDDKVVLVEQYRVPVKANTIEVTAGLIGDEEEFAGESLAETANRELIEETGYSAGSMTHLIHTPSSAGLADEMIHLFFATDLTRIGEGGGVAGENITVHEVPRAELDDWLDEQTQAGKLIDSKIHAALWIAMHRGMI